MRCNICNGIKKEKVVKKKARPKRKFNMVNIVGSELLLHKIQKWLNIGGNRKLKGADVLSLKKLLKMIQTYHPCDPNTKKKFKITSSVTIIDFHQRLFCYPSCKSVVIKFKRCSKVALGCF